jgi:hypothetical protein
LCVAAPAEPLFHFCAKPPDWAAAELVFLRKSADKGEGVEKPVVPTREPRYFMRGQDLVPYWKSFVDPARERHVCGGESRLAQRSPRRVVDIHGATCPLRVVPVAQGQVVTQA